MNQDQIDIDHASATASSVEFRPMAPVDYANVTDMARALPEWFNEDGISQISAAVHHQEGVVAEVDDNVVGFVTWCTHDGIGEISWIAVSSGHHRRGIGARLLEFAENSLREAGVTELQVETLGDSVDYEPYERTRAFYRTNGFRDFKRVMTDNPSMPESLTLRKSLSAPSNP